MALLGSLHRVLQLQRCTGVVLLRSSVVSVGSNLRPIELLQTSPKRKPQPCMFLSSDSNDKRKLPALEVPEEVDIGPGTWREVYQGILTTQIRMVKVFSLSTSCLGLMMQPVLLQKVVGSQMGLAIAIGSFIGFFTFATPLLIHWITKKYVTRLEYDAKQDMYSATTLSFFLREKKIHFSVDDVEVPTVPGIFTTFHAKNKPLFVEPSMFQDMEHYGRIMGYDKPIDFSLEDEDEKQK